MDARKVEKPATSDAEGGSNEQATSRRAFLLVTASVAVFAALIFGIVAYQAREQVRCNPDSVDVYVMPDILATVGAIVAGFVVLVVGALAAILLRSWRIALATLVILGAIAVGRAGGLAAAGPLCPPPPVPPAGTLVIELGSGWDRRLSGQAKCVRDRVTGAIVRVEQTDSHGRSWQTDGWGVEVDFDDYRASDTGPAPGGVAREVINLEQAASNPYHAAYWLRAGSTARSVNDADGNGGTVMFSALVLDTLLEELPFDPEGETKPFLVPRLLDVTIAWHCPPPTTGE